MIFTYFAAHSAAAKAIVAAGNEKPFAIHDTIGKLKSCAIVYFGNSGARYVHTLSRLSVSELYMVDQPY